MVTQFECYVCHESVSIPASTSVTECHECGTEYCQVTHSEIIVYDAGSRIRRLTAKVDKLRAALQVIQRIAGGEVIE